MKKAFIELNYDSLKLFIIDQETQKVVYEEWINKGFQEKLPLTFKERTMLQKQSIEQCKQKITDEMVAITQLVFAAERGLNDSIKTAEQLLKVCFSNTQLKVLVHEEEHALFCKGIARSFPNQKIVVMDVRRGSIPTTHCTYHESGYFEIHEQVKFYTGISNVLGSLKMVDEHQSDTQIQDEYYDVCQHIWKDMDDQFYVMEDTLVVGSDYMKEFVLTYFKGYDNDPIQKYHDIYLTKKSVQAFLEQIMDIIKKERRSFFETERFRIFRPDFHLINMEILARHIHAEKIYVSDFSYLQGLD